MGQRLTGFYDRFRASTQTTTRDTSEYGLCYLSGLLRMDTKRTMANIGRMTAIGTQNMQHFVSNSPWSARAVIRDIQDDIKAHSEFQSGAMLALDESADEKAADVRPYLQYAREERELTITAIDTLDAMLEQLGLVVPGPNADDVAADAHPAPGEGTAGVMAAFRAEVEADLATMRQRIRQCRDWIDDRDAYVQDDFGTGALDLARLGDYERAVEFIRDHIWARAVLDAPVARDSTLDIATDLYLETFEQVPDDLGQITKAVVKARRQTAKQKRNACIEILGTGKRNRDALADSLALTDEIARALGLDLAATPLSPPAPRPTPAPEPEPSPTPAPEREPSPTPEPAVGAMETPVPDPFADL